MMIRPACNEAEISLRDAASIPAKTLRIFIADDDAAVASVLVDLVGDIGHQVAGVESSHAGALSAAEVVAADVAILDINLRGRPSFAIADRLLARGIPVIFATGYGILELSGKYANAQLLKKPFKRADLADALAQSTRDAAAVRRRSHGSREVRRPDIQPSN